jgi:hypothetical protein
MEQSANVKVGMGATLCFPSDRRPYVVVSVGRASLKVQALDTRGIGVTGLGYGVADHTLSPEEYRPIGKLERAWKHKDGFYYMHGSCRLCIGEAHYRRDFND